MTRRRAAVAELREQGLTQREIGDVIGVDQSTVARDANASKEQPNNEQSIDRDANASTPDDDEPGALAVHFSSDHAEHDTPRDVVATSPIRRPLPERIAALEAEIATLRAQRDELLITAIALVMGDHTFGAAELWTRATVDNPELLARLHESGITSPRKLGKQLQRLNGRVLGRLYVERAGIDHHVGVLWTVKVIPHFPMAPCAPRSTRA